MRLYFTHVHGAGILEQHRSGESISFAGRTIQGERGGLPSSDPAEVAWIHAKARGSAQAVEGDEDIDRVAPHGSPGQASIFKESRADSEPLRVHGNGDAAIHGRADTRTSD